MIEVKAPHKFDQSDFYHPTLFLAGSIENGVAEQWQEWVVKELSDLEGLILNPRRDQWDAKLDHDTTPGSEFYQQVEWELDHQFPIFCSLETTIYTPSVHAFYFAANTMSPITLLEFGMALGMSDYLDSIVVYVDDDFLRKGNVIITCEKMGVKWTNDKKVFIERLREQLE